MYDLRFAIVLTVAYEQEMQALYDSVGYARMDHRSWYHRNSDWIGGINYLMHHDHI